MRVFGSMQLIATCRYLGPCSYWRKHGSTVSPPNGSSFTLPVSLSPSLLLLIPHDLLWLLQIWSLPRLVSHGTPYKWKHHAQKPQLKWTRNLISQLHFKLAAGHNAVIDEGGSALLRHVAGVHWASYDLLQKPSTGASPLRPICSLLRHAPMPRRLGRGRRGLKSSRRFLGMGMGRGEITQCHRWERLSVLMAKTAQQKGKGYHIIGLLGDVNQNRAGEEAKRSNCNANSSKMNQDDTIYPLA